MRCQVSLWTLGLTLLLSLLWTVLLSGNVCAKAYGQDIPPPPEIQQTGPHNAITLRVAGMPGHYTGFDLIADNLLVAPVRFTSHDLIWSAKAVATNNGLTSTLVFEDIQADPDCGLHLEHSHIVVTLQSQHYPTVAFDLRLAAFDPITWQQTLGAQPFHFLTLGMPDATAWHQEGWLFATPRADLFPLLLDPHDHDATLSAAYNREWSRTPPLSAHALPVIGLWAPARKSYVAWDFQATRFAPNASGDYLEGSSERDLATGFCNRLIVSTDVLLPQSQETVPASAPLPDEDTPQSKNGLPPPKRDPRTRKALSYMQQTSREYDQRGVSKFVALVSPPGGADSRQLVYPKPGTRLSSQAVLMFSTDLPGTDDPNRFLWQQWWNTPAIYSVLPRVPRVVNTGGLSLPPRPQHLGAAPDGSLIVRAKGEAYLPGSLIFSRQDGRDAGAVDAPAAPHDAAARLVWLQAEVSTLLKYIHYFPLDKEPCAYWPDPLAGEWTPASGGEPTTTLHHAQGWTAARTLLALYRAKREKEKESREEGKGKREKNEANSRVLFPLSSSLFPALDGVFNWAKHVVWMRGGLKSDPALPMAQDNALAAAFLLDYYFTFEDDLLDAPHRTRALLALDMARSFIYRALILRAGNAAGDDADEAFQWMTRLSGLEASENNRRETADSLDMLAQVAVHTGDPILLWALQGSVARLSRTQPFGTPGGEMIVPPANADVQALCGEKAALAFDRIQANAPDNDLNNTINNNTNNTDGKYDRIVITSYRCTGAGDFAFTLHRVRATGLASAVNTPMCANVTFPYVDLSRKPVAVRHGNVQQRVLQPGTELARDPRTPWSLRVSGLREGDTVMVGNPEFSGAEKRPCAPPLLEGGARSAKNMHVRPTVPLSPPSSASLGKITGTLRKQKEIGKQDETKRRPARP